MTKYLLLLCLLLTACEDPFGTREEVRRLVIARKAQCMLRMSMAPTHADSLAVLDWRHGSGWAEEYSSCSHWLVADTLPNTP